MGTFANIIAQNEAMTSLISVAKKISASDISVLITGENGVGKKLLAESIHNFSNRYSKNFVMVDCKAIPESLIEQELFGNFKDSQDKKKVNYLDKAKDGTLFLYNVDFLSDPIQEKLLQTMETNQYIRSDKKVIDNLNVRVISAAKDNLMAKVENSSIRMDFYYRIKEITLEIPPLKSRQDDIPLLAKHFIKKFSSDFGKKIRTISDAALNLLVSHNWNGNVREFINVIRTSVALCKKESIWVENIPLNIEAGRGSSSTHDNMIIESYALKDVEKAHIFRTLNSCKWNKSKTAKLLQVSRPRLDRKISEYNLKKPKKKIK